MATAGMPYSRAFAIRSGMRTAPSRSEYSVCKWRCTKESEDIGDNGTSGRVCRQIRTSTGPLSFDAIMALFAFLKAEVAKLADAPDLGSGGAILRGSSPLLGKSLQCMHFCDSIKLMS